MGFVENYGQNGLKGDHNELVDVVTDPLESLLMTQKLYIVQNFPADSSITV